MQNIQSKTRKINVYLSEKTKKELQYDAEAFEFYKSDHQINLNGFLKTLIANYYQKYEETRTQIIESAELQLQRCGAPYDRDICIEIIDTVIRQTRTTEIPKDRRNAKISLTISSSSPAYECIQNIESQCLSHKALSQYLNDMLTSYLSIPRYAREKIIFRDSCHKIETAIKKRKMLSFTSTSDPSHECFQVSPYALVPSKPQENNYLLCYVPEKHTVMTFRLSRLRSVFFMDKKSEIDETNLLLLKEMEKYGPQFSFDTAELICVKFTEKGLRKFSQIYTNRPVIDQIAENDHHIYWFRWPNWAAYEYFKRFGKDAEILEPVSLREKLRNWYKEAVEKYST